RSRVVCRTRRGLEIGDVLAVVAGRGDPPDGSLLRRMTLQDELLQQRIEQQKREAMSACQERLAQASSQAVLVDAELLFDGQTLIFYFFGETPGELDGIVAELVEAYDAQVHFRRFAETMLAGCGPDCGTDQAAGCGATCTACNLSS